MENDTYVNLEAQNAYALLASEERVEALCFTGIIL